MTSPMPPSSLTAIARRVERRLEAFLAPELERWAGFDPDLVAPMADIGRLVLGGGKRLRPAFCHWGFLAAGGSVDAAESVPGPVVDAGAAFELMHAFALFHDDVMDDAHTRRGAITTHQRFAGMHRDGGWAGEERRFGEGIAILVGDLAFVYSDQLMAAAPPAAWSVWNELRIELNVGQLLDIVGSARSDRTVTRAERICRYKSGKYTVERPLHLGAALAAPDRLAELGPVLSAYGLPLGDAFQMRDDVIGAFGDPDVTGKPVGGDLREGKPTPLLARAVRSADRAQTAVLDRVGAPDLDDDEVGEIQRVIVATGALDELEAEIATRVAMAVEAVTDAVGLLDAAAVDELVALAAYITDRRH